jgi:N-methylhydantoinase A
VTDADLVLGLLNPEFFLGGRLALDAGAAGRAVDRDVAVPLGLTVEEAARGVYRTVTNNMAEAARVHAAERGIDLTGHLLVAFGGAGPVHAWAVARQLRLNRVVFPSHAGVESALGFLAAAPSFEAVRSDTRGLDGFQAPAAAAILSELAAAARAAVPGGAGDVRVLGWADMRYRGQGAEVRVPLPGLEPSAEQLRDAFLVAYRELYGREVHGVPVDVVTWRVRAERDAETLAVFHAVVEVPARGAPSPRTHRRAWPPDLDAPTEIPVYRRDALAEGMVIGGPALIEEAQSTLVLGRGRASVLRGGHVLCRLEDA